MKSHKVLSKIVGGTLLLLAILAGSWLSADAVLQSLDQPHVYPWLKSHTPPAATVAWAGIVLGSLFFASSFLPWPKETTGGRLPSAPRRKLRPPFKEYGVEWAEIDSGKLELRCPTHHTPLMFWPIPILYDRPGPRPSQRPVTDEDLPFKNDYARNAGTLFCADDKEEMVLSENLTVQQARQFLRIKHQGELNRTREDS